MVLSVRTTAGEEYLRLTTETLQSIRLGHPTTGVWEAADLQWWWRKDQHPDPARQSFWVQDGSPVAGAVLSDWGDRLSLDLLVPERGRTELLDLMEPVARQMTDNAGGVPLEMVVRDDDPVMIALSTRLRFKPSAEAGADAWLAPAHAPPQAPLPERFTIGSRDEFSEREHPTAARNGPHVAQRLEECGLYQQSLDLAIYGPDQEVAAYGLFWADPVTEVGLVEPIRTNDEFQRRGLGSALLRAGMTRLVDRGCTRIKVTYLLDNEASRRLYAGCGFTLLVTCTTYQRD
jgi:RimJ/RimL family protein N-acetyltransferase